MCEQCKLNPVSVIWFGGIKLCVVCAMRADNYSEEEIIETLNPTIIEEEKN